MAKLVEFVFLFCLMVSFANAANVNAICSKARDPQLCYKVLNSINGIEGMDYESLAKITINMAISDGRTVLTKIQYLKTRATGHFQSALTDCNSMYGDGLDNLNMAMQYLAQRDYFGVNTAASGAEDAGFDCQSSLGNDGQVLQDNNDHFSSMCSIILVVANILGGRA